MFAKQLIPFYNNINVISSSTAAFSPVVGSTQEFKTNNRNVNNSGLVFVTQAEGGNLNASCALWGSLDGTNFSPLISLIAFTAASGGAAQTLLYPLTLPVYLKLYLTGRASTVNNETSGVSVSVVY